MESAKELAIYITTTITHNYPGKQLALLESFQLHLSLEYVHIY